MLTVQPHGEEYAIMRGEEVLALFGSHAEAMGNLEVLKRKYVMLYSRPGSSEVTEIDKRTLPKIRGGVVV